MEHEWQVRNCVINRCNIYGYIPANNAVLLAFSNNRLFINCHREQYLYSDSITSPSSVYRILQVNNQPINTPIPRPRLPIDRAGWDVYQMWNTSLNHVQLVSQRSRSIVMQLRTELLSLRHGDCHLDTNEDGQCPP